MIDLRCEQIIFSRTGATAVANSSSDLKDIVFGTNYYASCLAVYSGNP